MYKLVLEDSYYCYFLRITNTDPSFVCRNISVMHLESLRPSGKLRLFSSLYKYILCQIFPLNLCPRSAVVLGSSAVGKY